MVDNLNVEYLEGYKLINVLQDHAINEDHTLACDGAKVNFVTANEFMPETTAIYYLGDRIGLGDDYTEDAGYDAVTLTAAPDAAEDLIIDYIIA